MQDSGKIIRLFDLTGLRDVQYFIIILSDVVCAGTDDIKYKGSVMHHIEYGYSSKFLIITYATKRNCSFQIKERSSHDIFNLKHLNNATHK